MCLKRVCLSNAQWQLFLFCFFLSILLQSLSTHITRNTIHKYGFVLGKKYSLHKRICISLLYLSTPLWRSELLMKIPGQNKHWLDYIYAYAYIYIYIYIYSHIHNRFSCFLKKHKHSNYLNLLKKNTLHKMHLKFTTFTGCIITYPYVITQ